MKTLSSFIIVLMCISISACACLPTKSDMKLIPVSDVLNAVKDELNAYLSTKPTIPAKKGVCNGGNTAQIDLVPSEVKLTLQTVAAQTSEPSVGLTVPIGVISVGPSYSGAYSRSRTQILQVPLKVDLSKKPQAVAPGDHPIAKAISEFRDELLKVDHDKTPCFSSSEDMMLTIAFDVINKSAGGFTLKLAFVNLGDKETFSDEAHQKLEMKFKLIDSLFFK